MAEVETVTIPTSTEHASRVSQHGSSIGGEAPEVSAARAGERIIPMPSLPTQTLQVGKRTLSEAARERVAKIIETRQLAEAKAKQGAQAASAASAVTTDSGGSQDAARVTPPAPSSAVTAPPSEVKIAEVSTRGTIDPNAPAPIERDDDPDAPPGTAAPAVTPEQKQVAAPATPDELAELRSVVERQARLLEQRRTEREGKTRVETDAVRARAERFVAAEEAYAQDPVNALAEYVAAIIGAKDAKDPAVAAELDDLITDLTAMRLSVSLDPAHQANRKATLTDRRVKLAEQRLQARDRDEAGKRTKDEETSRAQGFQREHISPAIADRAKYPHLQLSAHLDREGRTAEQVVYAAIRRGLENGTIDPREKIEVAIAKAAAAEETAFRARAESLRSALNPGTVASSPTPPASQRADGQPAAGKNGQTRQGHGSRTLTTADASVAPATTTTQQPAEGQRPRYKNDDERRRAVIKKHFPDHPAARSRR